MNSEMLQTICPALRGLTFDGEKGKIITTETGTERVRGRIQSEMPKGVLLIDPGELNNGEGLVPSLKQLYTRHVDAEGREPDLFVIGDDAVSAAGPSYDAAKQRLENYLSGAEQPETDQPVRTGRNSVVVGKVCVVTGGAQGFGAELAAELTSMGGLVIVADLNSDGAAACADRLNRKAGQTAAIPVEVDVTDEQSVSAMVEKIVKTVGGIDLFVSNAGVLKAGSVKEISFKDFSFVTSVNYLGYFLCTKHASPVMALQNSASGSYFTDIIQINSKSGLQGSNRNSAYAGGKFGGIGLTQSFAMELVEDNIKVNSICPGNFFDGPLWSDPKNGLFVQYLNAGKIPGAKNAEDVRKFYEQKVPMKRGCTGKDVAQAMYYIIDQKYETGQAVPVTGGQNMLK